MVSAGDSLQTALARETWEEAGLDLAPLQQLRHGGHVDFACPSDEGGDGTGYMLESINWFHAVVPQACNRRTGRRGGAVPVHHAAATAGLAAAGLLHA
jgi:8-oxo-dGTP pyrophosphatase MutT (NUDIX family)